MKRIVALMLTCLLCVTLILPSVAASVPFDSALATVRSAVEQSVGQDTAGAAVLLIDCGTARLPEGYGYADLSSRTVVTADTAFEIGELSSLFVLLAVRKLAASGALDLEADIATYLSDSFMKKLALAYPVTTNDLLYGVAGFEGRMTDLRFTKDAYCFETLEEALLAEIPRQTVRPGTYYSYSPFGIGLAALVVEYASGKAYDTYVTETVLTPLGMSATLLNPRMAALPDTMAAGHVANGEGSFSVCEDGGHSVAGIWPADGAVSTAADLALLLSHLMQTGCFEAQELYENGIFTTGAAGATVYDGTFFYQAGTLAHSAALCVDAATGNAALVLANVTDCALLNLPALLYGTVIGTSIAPTDALLDTKLLTGTYASAAFSRESLVGRLQIKDHSIRVKEGEDGTLIFGDRTLRQLQPGIFTDREGNVATVQFLLDEEGEVVALLTAEGETYLPVSFAESGVPTLVLFFLLIAGALYFLCGAVFSVMGAVRTPLRTDERPAWRFVLPWLFSGLLALFVLIQTFVAVGQGSVAIASFFTAMSVIAIILATAGTLCYVFAIFTAFTERGRISRVVRNALLFLLFLVLCGYWRVIYI